MSELRFSIAFSRVDMELEMLSSDESGTVVGCCELCGGETTLGRLEDGELAKSDVR